MYSHRSVPVRGKPPNIAPASQYRSDLTPAANPAGNVPQVFTAAGVCIAGTAGSVTAAVEAAADEAAAARAATDTAARGAVLHTADTAARSRAAVNTAWQQPSHLAASQLLRHSSPGLSQNQSGSPYKGAAPDHTIQVSLYRTSPLRGVHKDVVFVMRGALSASIPGL